MVTTDPFDAWFAGLVDAFQRDDICTVGADQISGCQLVALTDDIVYVLARRKYEDIARQLEGMVIRELRRIGIIGYRERSKGNPLVAAILDHARRVSGQVTATGTSPSCSVAGWGEWLGVDRQ